jgi:hypothetical protein
LGAVHGQDDEPAVQQVPFPKSRPLTTKERALIDFLLDGPLGRAELREQAQTARVVGVCSCGCPSVYLEVDGTAPIIEFRADEPGSARSDWVPIKAIQPKTRGMTEVTLHVVEGRLHELEIWGSGYGVRPRVDPTKLEYEFE